MRTSLALITVLLAASTAFADPPKYTRPQKLDIPVAFSNRTRPIQPAATAAAKPEVDGTAVMLVEERREPLRREQEIVLEKLVANTPDGDPDKADLLFRLAEHYAKQQRFWRLESIGLETQKH